MADAAPPNTFRQAIHERSPSVFLAPFGIRFAGTLGLLFDKFAQAAQDAVVGRYIRNDGPAFDALRPLGEERSMPQYATETWAQFKARLGNAWDSWEFAGDENTIARQLELAGFPGAEVYRWRADSVWSEFYVFFPQGTHTVTAAAPLIGSFTVGDGTIIGPVGVTPAELDTIGQIILQWKPARWRCRWVVWEISGWTIGTGHLVGEVDLLIGGQQASSKVQ